MIRKMYLIEIINLLEPYKKNNFFVLRYGKIFKPEEFYVFFESMLNVANNIEDFYIIVEISRRIGLIVILQEDYYALSSYSDANINIDEIEKLAKERFKFSNRDKSKFNHPQIIHPKNPFSYYGNDLKSLNGYRDALEILVEYPKIYIYNDDAISHLLQLYDRIKE